MAFLDYFKKKKMSLVKKQVDVEQQKLQDGSIYTGQAIMLEKDLYMPYGYGKRIFGPHMEMIGHWIDGKANGMCYLNLHDSMITGHFVENKPTGWCIKVEKGNRYVFGVFNNGKCIQSLNESVSWIIHSMNWDLKTSYKYEQILVGELIGNESRGFHFMNNGDLYIGIDESNLSKTGFFFKFTKDGFIEIGEFKNGTLVEKLPGEEVVDANFGNFHLYKPLNAKKKYF